MLLFRNSVNCSRRAPGYLTLIGGKDPPAARNASEIAQNWRYYPHTESSRLIWCLSSSPPFSEEFFYLRRSMLPGPRDKGLTTTLTLFTCPLNWNRKDERMGAMDLDQHASLHSSPSLWCSRGCDCYCLCKAPRAVPGYFTSLVTGHEIVVKFRHY